MSWSPAMRAARRTRGGQIDMFDDVILRFGLFDGDRDANVRVLSNRMLVTRKVQRCVICQQDIAPGSRVRAQSEVSRDDNTVMTFHVCPTCCTCIRALRERGDFEALTERYVLGERHARPACA